MRAKNTFFTDCYPMPGRKVFSKYRAAIYDAVASDQGIRADSRLMVDIFVVIIKIINRLADRTIIANDGVIAYFDIVIDYGVITNFNILADFNILAQPNIMIIKHDMPPFDTPMSHQDDI
jgi:hypothetical protein